MTTLGDLLNALSINPAPVYFFCGAVLIVILVLHFVVGSDDAQLSPWNYIYSTLVYLVCIPGIFSVFINVYQFLFERKSIMEANLITQILPIVVMVAALYLIKQTVSLRSLPGFGKLSSLLMTIALVFIFMFIIDRTRLIFGVFSFLPIYQVALLFLGLFLLLRFAMGRLFS